MSLSRSFVPVLAALLALAVPVNAWAYLDPGTGSYLFQLAAAGIFAGMMTIKLYYQRIKNWVRARREPALPGPDDSKPT